MGTDDSLARRASEGLASKPSLARRANNSSYSSSSKCALTPPKPKPLIAARRGVVSLRRRHSRPSLRTWNGDSSILIPGAGVAKFAVGGNVCARIADSTLTTPDAPAAVSRCPTVDFTCLLYTSDAADDLL